MHVIWKRPDGFHNSRPEDFRVIEIQGQSNLWLHKTERYWFPFQISGDWKASDDTKRLNNLVNLLGESDDRWLSHLKDVVEDSFAENPGKNVDDKINWIKGLKLHLKGDKWETEILNLTLSAIENKLLTLKPQIEKTLSN